MKRGLTVGLSGLLIVSLLVLLQGAPSAAIDTTGTLKRVSPTGKVYVGDTVVFKGRFSGGGDRHFVLQKSTGSKWSTIKSTLGWTDHRGNFRVTYKPTRTFKYRVMLLRVPGSGARVSSVLKVAIAPTVWRQVAAGRLHSCAVLNGYALRCWGYDGDGQLGDGPSSGADVKVPVRIGSRAWSMIAPGYRDTCGIQRDASLWCWGGNAFGEVGNGNKIRKNAPVHIGTASWDSVALGVTHTCGIQSDGSLWCWGGNIYGQLGDGTNDESHVPIPGPAGTWLSVTAGYGHTCGIQTDHTLHCWGYNGYGQLGNGFANTTWRMVVAGQYHTCGIKTDDTLWCWGLDTSGQLGDGGSGTINGTPKQVGSGTWSTVSTGYNHTCGIMTDGSAWCWGTNGDNQLGDGSGSDQHTPVRVGEALWKSIATGESHTCGIRSNGTAWCWGNNNHGQLGDGTKTSRPLPVRVTDHTS